MILNHSFVRTVMDSFRILPVELPAMLPRPVPEVAEFRDMMIVPVSSEDRTTSAIVWTH